MNRNVLLNKLEEQVHVAELNWLVSFDFRFDSYARYLNTFMLVD